MNPASSEAKNATAAATSSGWPRRPSGMPRTIALMYLSPPCSTIFFNGGVPVGPRAHQDVRIVWGPIGGRGGADAALRTLNAVEALQALEAPGAHVLYDPSHIRRRIALLAKGAHSALTETGPSTASRRRTA